MRISIHSIRAAAVALLLSAGSAAVADAPRHAVARATPVSVCTASTFHPLSVHVSALDPIARGAVVRLRLTASSAVGLDQVEARLLSTGGATNRGATRIPLGALAPGRAAEGVFTVAIPASGGRRFVQFQVAGQGPQGPLTRGACYNLLPDGPAQPGRVVVTPDGARVLETAARRID